MARNPAKFAFIGGLAAALAFGLPVVASAQQPAHPAPQHARSHAAPADAHAQQVQHRNAEQCWLGTDGDHPYYGYAVSCDTPRAIHAN